jgi:hypothetical protein
MTAVMWRLLMPLLIMLSSFAPHCALAAPPAPSSQHHAGMDHHKPQTGHVHADAACVGCATPARQNAVTPRLQVPVTHYDGPSPRIMTTLVRSPEPPPPRPLA